MQRTLVFGVVMCAGIVVAQDDLPEPQKAAAEHKFLKQFVGEWECENEAYLEPGKPPLRMESTMTAHMIGDFWVVVDVKGDSAGQPYRGQATFGYDSTKRKKYIGTWADSMSDFLWKYEGIVDGTKLVLDSEGPNPLDPERMMKARDTWDFKSENLIILTSEIEGPDGKMTLMMKASCKRK